LLAQQNHQTMNFYFEFVNDNLKYWDTQTCIKRKKLRGYVILTLDIITIMLENDLETPFTLRIVRSICVYCGKISKQDLHSFVIIMKTKFVIRT
jgi:hypothetical protein